MIIESQHREGQWDFVCTEPRCSFISIGWDTERLATVRGDEHQAEHETEEPMRELAEFIAEANIAGEPPADGTGEPPTRDEAAGGER